MITASVRDFRDHATQMLKQREPVMITRHGKVVGFFMPATGEALPLEIKRDLFYALTERFVVDANPIKRMNDMIVTIFRNRLRPEHEAEYYPFAGQVRELAEKMPGFIAQKSYKSDDGERVSIVEFASEETHRAWREHPEHRVAQELGRTKFYSEYHVQVCSLDRQYGFPEAKASPL